MILSIINFISDLNSVTKRNIQNFSSNIFYLILITERRIVMDFILKNQNI